MSISTYAEPELGAEERLERLRRTVGARGLHLARVDDLEMREKAAGEDYSLIGHAAVFGSLSEDLGGFREMIEPGFFRGALRGKPDVKLLLNHESYPVLARTSSGTLELREDVQGLRSYATVAPTQAASDLRLSMQRGDIDQMSFAFSLVREGGDDWAIAEDGTIVRTLRAGGCDELYDVSVVTYPAYQRTDAAMRAILGEAWRHLGKGEDGANGGVAAGEPDAERPGRSSEADHHATRVRVQRARAAARARAVRLTGSPQ